MPAVTITDLNITIFHQEMNVEFDVAYYANGIAEIENLKILDEDYGYVQATDAEFRVIAAHLDEQEEGFILSEIARAEEEDGEKANYYILFTPMPKFKSHFKLEIAA